MDDRFTNKLAICFMARTTAVSPWIEDCFTRNHLSEYVCYCRSFKTTYTFWYETIWELRENKTVGIKLLIQHRFMEYFHWAWHSKWSLFLDNSKRKNFTNKWMNEFVIYSIWNNAKNISTQDRITKRFDKKYNIMLILETRILHALKLFWITGRNGNSFRIMPIIIRTLSVRSFTLNHTKLWHYWGSFCLIKNVLQFFFFAHLSFFSIFCCWNAEARDAVKQKNRKILYNIKP